MKLLFATGRDFLPERIGGAEWSAHALLDGARRGGWRVEAACAIGDSWRLHAYRALRLLSRRRALALVDRANGYPTRRAWSELLGALVEERLRRFAPDLALVQLEDVAAIARRAIDAGVPTIVRIPDPKLRWLDGPLPQSPLVLALANSRYTADRVRERLGLAAEVIYPVVDPAAYRVARRRPEFITFINPVPDKGVELALEVAAALPRRRFLFVENWWMPAPAWAELSRAAARLGNVVLRRRSLDVRPVYARTAVLMVPSRWEESFPRVIAEAHANRIPVVASADGGIPEALGRGGVLLPIDAPAAAWAEALDGLLSDRALFDELSARAAANLARPELDAAVQIERFLALAARHAAGRRGRSCGSRSGRR